MKTQHNLSVLKHLIGGLLVGLLLLVNSPARPASATGVDRYVAGSGSNSGDCSSSPCATIGYAITQASSDDVIHIAAGTYTEHISIDKNLTFQGAGMDQTYLDGGGGGRVVGIDDIYTVAFSDLTIQHGNVSSGYGGGISTNGGSLTLTRVKVTGNTADMGGGIFSNGPISITNGIISDNTAAALSAYGGGLYLNQGGTTSSLSNVTISGNTSNNASGGIHNQGTGTLNLTNVTISGNTAGHIGGMDNSATAVLVNTTIADNHYSAGGWDGGVANYATISFKNTLIAGNDGDNCFNYSTGTTWTSLGYNLDSAHSCNFTLTGDLHDADPLLGALTDNGGPTPTIALNTGSPAFNAGTTSGCPATDQRGVERPQGSNCDIGAYEARYRYVAGTGSDSSNDCSVNANPCQTVAYAMSQADNNEVVKITAGIYPAHLTVDKNLAFIGAGMDQTFLDGSGGGGGRVIEIESGRSVLMTDLAVQNGSTTSEGGGIYNSTSTLILQRVKVANNTASLGGGIASDGPLSMTDSEVSGNTAEYSLGIGGGLFLNQAGTSSFTNVTISGNTSALYGGGLHQQYGTLNLTNVTISGNTAASSGGAMSTGASSVINLLNSTIADNHSAGIGGIDVYNETVNFKNTIVSANDNANCSVDGASGTLNSLGHNLASDNTCHFTGTGDLPNTDPQLEPLSYYGGFTLVQAPKSGSPVIDAGDNSGCPAYDQRGLARPVGTTCDIGAVEYAEVSISGTVNGIGGATLSYYNDGPQSVVAADDGTYSLTVVYYWTGTVTPSKPGYVFTPASRSYTLSPVISNLTGQDFDATVFTPTIQGNAGVGNATIYYSGTAASGSTTADGTGHYSITVPYNWTGTVSPNKTGYTFSPSDRKYLTGVTTDLTGQNFTALVTISGNAGDSSVILHYVYGTARTVTSASNGRYTITVPYKWAGTVTPSKTGVTFTPSSRSYTSVTVNKTGQNYTDTFTFTSTGAQDGWILESTETSNTGGSMNSTATTFQLGDDNQNRQYRTILSFNTASLPDTATIASAVLKIKQSGSPTGSNPFTVLGTLYADLRKGFFGTSSALQLTDFNATASATKVAAFGKTPVSGWYSATLNATGRSNVNKTSLTQFRLYFSKDDNNDHIADFMKFISGNSSSSKPQLVITYTIP